MRATAFIIGPRDGSGTGLMDLCLGIGFESVRRFSQIEEAEQQVAKTPPSSALEKGNEHRQIDFVRKTGEGISILREDFRRTPSLRAAERDGSAFFSRAAASA